MDGDHSLNRLLRDDPCLSGSGGCRRRPAARVNFYSYGLELFCKVRPSLGLLLTIIIFFIQIPLSVWWLRRFQFGPIEWLWRSLTYWQPQPMRVRRRQ